jgi:hypothetical protein
MKRKVINTLIGIVLLFYSCQNIKSKQQEYEVKDKNQYGSESFIAKYDSLYLFEDGSHVDSFYIDRDQFIKPYISYSCNNDTIHASSFFELNQCAKYKPGLKIIDNKIQLILEKTTESKCKSVYFYKYNFVIVMKNACRYEIIF